jgi:hypothetical protein
MVAAILLAALATAASAEEITVRPVNLKLESGPAPAPPYREGLRPYYFGFDVEFTNPSSERSMVKRVFCGHALADMSGSRAWYRISDDIIINPGITVLPGIGFRRDDTSSLGGILKEPTDFQCKISLKP